MKKTIFFSLLFLSSIGLSYAQTKVTGKVTAADDGNPIPFATIVVKGTNVAATTNDQGVYSINVPPNGKVLVFTFFSMETQEIEIGARSVVDVALHNATTQLDETIVVAYGTVKRASFTGSASTVSSRDIASRPVSSVTTALEGSAPGIQVAGTSGQPGESPAIRIRGIGSINSSNAPLLVVDGFPYPGNLSNINQDEIESISLLKDASSAALYGSQAANGVILVTTKRGKDGKFTVDFKTTHGVSARSIPEYDRIGRDGYVPILWEFMRNGQVTASGKTLAEANQIASTQIMGANGLKYNPYNVPDDQVMLTDGTLNPNARILFDDFDWEKAITRGGYRGEYTLTASGGTRTSDYLFSVGYLNEKGYLIATDFDRINARANVNVSPKKWLMAGLNVGTSIIESNYSTADSDNSTGYTNLIYFTRNIAPIYPIHRFDPLTGNPILDENGNLQFEWDNRAFSTGRHVIAETEFNSRSFDRNSLNARSYVAFNILEGLRLTLNVGADIDNTYSGVAENTILGDGAPGGRSRRQYTKYQTWNTNQLLTYDRIFAENHNISLLAGHESFDWQYNYFYGMKTGEVLAGNSELVNYTTPTSLTSLQHKRAIESYFSRINYGFKDKYYLSVSFRTDGSSRFHKDVRWGNFWSIGASWRVDGEEFFKVSWIDMLKLRTAYGQTGNEGVLDSDGYNSYYPWMGLYVISNNAAEPGFISSTNSGNSDLRWETNSNIDVALEFAMFDRRLTGVIEFFHRISDDLLFSVPQPLSSGVVAQYQNAGTMFNQGFEVQLSADVLRNRDLRWNVTLNLTTFKNEITKLPQEEIIVGTKKRMVGRSIYDFWLRSYAGVNSNTGAPIYFLNEENKANYPANSYYEYNGRLVTESINQAKYDYHGTAIPDFYGSFINTFSYKDFDFSFLLTFQVGGKQYDTNYANLMIPAYGSALHVDANNRWRNPGDVTSVPRVDAGIANNVGGASSRWLVDASYLSFRSFTLGYSLPKSFLSKIDLSAVRVFAAGENLLLVAKRKGMNPTQSFAGTTANVYEPARIFTLGLGVTF